MKNTIYETDSTPEKYQKNMLGYYRMITGVDNAVGSVIKALETKKVADNTIVIFMSDNGFYMANRGFAGKWSHYEESLRLPLIVKAPTLAKQKPVCTAMVLNIDIPSTILGFAGIEQPATYQGKDLSPLLTPNAYVKLREDFLCEHHMPHKAIPKWEGVRNERYIYARYFENSYEFLHDLETDPDQLTNLAKDPEYKDLLKKLSARCDALISQAKK